MGKFNPKDVAAFHARLKKTIGQNVPRCTSCNEWLDLDDDDKGLGGLCYGCARKAGKVNTLAKGRQEPGENCPHCGALFERGDDGQCNSCGKDWPEATTGDPAKSGDGGQGWNCPWCRDVNVSDTPERDRDCYKCGKKVDVVEEKGRDGWRVYPAPLSKAAAAVRAALNKAHASGYPLQGRTVFQGLPISIENRKGSYREDKHNDPPQWRNKMYADYGYVRGSCGVDSDHVDVFLGPNPNATHAFIVRQVRPDTGAFDEQKILLGCDSAVEAEALYKKHYDSPKFFGGIKAMPMAEFKEKVTKTLHGQKLIKAESLPAAITPDYIRHLVKLAEADKPNFLAVEACKAMAYGSKEMEDVAIRFNKTLPAARKAHKFQPAKWTHKNGHPRCKLCGDEPTEDGICRPLAKSFVRLLRLVKSGRTPYHYESGGSPDNPDGARHAVPGPSQSRAQTAATGTSPVRQQQMREMGAAFKKHGVKFQNTEVIGNMAFHNMHHPRPAKAAQDLAGTLKAGGHNVRLRVLNGRTPAVEVMDRADPKKSHMVRIYPTPRQSS